jgi:hypothetical protein
MDESVPAPIGTPPPANTPWIILGVVVAIALIVYVMRRMAQRRAEQEPTTPLHVTVTRATDSTPPSLPPPNDDRLTAREKRQEEIRRHVGSHFDRRHCLYCTFQALKPMPVFKPVRSIFDAALRRLGVSRLDRWYVEINPGIESPQVLCERHFERARGLMELELAEVSAEGAAFMDKLRRRVQTYETYELDEQLLNDVQETKKGKPARRHTRSLPEPANVRQLTTAKEKTA